MNKATELALETWYKPDSPLYRDPLHPTIKLAGEAGELLDLYGKNEYKPHFSWWQCKHCSHGDASHSSDGACITGSFNKDIVNPTAYTPLVLDELGDIWYYLRILMFQFDCEVTKYSLSSVDTLLEEILRMNMSAAKLAVIIEASDNLEVTLFETIYGRFMNILGYVDIALDELTELNYRKLHGGDNHGWKDAR